MTATIQEIATSELETETRIAQSTCTVKMIGCAESAALTELDGFLKRLHRLAVDAKVPEVVVDMRSLEFMNSSCFKQFVRWVNTLQESPPDAQYSIRYTSATFRPGFGASALRRLVAST